MSSVGSISEELQPSANSSGRREELCTMHLLLYSRLLQETFGVCCFFGGDNRMMRYGFILTKSFMNLSSALNKTISSTARTITVL